jgi:hypothetical protein
MDNVDPNNPNPNPSSTTDPNPSGVTVTAPDPQAVARQQELILNRLREQDEEIKRLRAQADAPPKTPEPPVAEQNKEFWADPMTVLRRELKETVKPLIEFRDEFKATSQYDRLKADAKNDPRFKDFLAMPGVENQIDQLMSKNPAPTAEALNGTIMGLRGAVEFGLVPGLVVTKKEEKPNNADPKQPPPMVDNNVLPPHMRPSAAPAPRGDGEKTKTRELSENERRLARERGLSEAAYIELTDEVKPIDVVSYKTPEERAKAGAK